MSYQVPMMFHPTLVVEDLAQASDWFQRVFGRRGVRWEEKYDFSKLKGDYPKEYSIFVHLGDVVLDVLSPKLLELPDGMENLYPAGEGLTDIAWYTEDARQVARHLVENGIRVRDQGGRLVDDGNLPPSSLADDMYILWTLPEDTGLTYEFLEMGRQHREFYSRAGDPRLAPDWTLRPPRDDDPLGIVRSLQHTILTTDPGRAGRLYTGVFGGVPLASGRNDHWEADSTFVEFAGSVLEFARPRSGTVTDVFTGETTAFDSYVGMTFQVVDVERVTRHLESHGIGVERSAATVSTIPEDTMGVRWTFTEHGHGRRSS
ncbi:VOC family protein [Geodermatophilus sp. CPCC 205506]|uniref:VOC family protein n=1 Tax=Geodermatophilus sp. CPCC 205506 TaxID=2936596 RepID=UPI003F52D4CD